MTWFLNSFTHSGADCSLKVCPSSSAWADQSLGVDDAHNPAECSNMGVCDRSTGLCSCRTGFEGKACERKSCPSNCNGVGVCQSLLYYAQTKDPGLGTVYSYTSRWDAEKIYGCNCDGDYYGIDCSLRECPSGDDPLTGTGASTTSNPSQVNEQQKVTCVAGAGYFTLTFRGKTTAQIPYNTRSAALQAYIEALTTIGTGTIKLTMFSTQACLESGATWTVEFLQNFGDLPLMIPDASNVYFSDPSRTATVTVSEYQQGTKEDEQCSNRGICDITTGICSCNTNYDTSNGYNAAGTRGDCGYATATIQVCPGTVSCSAHGKCSGNPTYRCSCSDGWTGSDCSERVCPKGVSWFTYPSAAETMHISEYVECSDMGICDRDAGTCTCDSGFTGAKCEYLTCPGEESLCNGHGECLDMYSLANRALENGVYPTTLHSYGLIPNNPDTWDATKVYGCLCDSKYSGYDCSESLCPYGDNPSTKSQSDEQQIIYCADADVSGSIVFNYKEELSSPVAASATTATVKETLESMAGIGEVNVDIATNGNTDSICTSAGNQFIITFLTEHGDLPELKLTTLSIGTTSDPATVTEYRKGTKEWEECSGKGLCDRSTGICSCFSGYGSSDGKGGEGTKADCGYIEPLAIISAE